MRVAPLTAASPSLVVVLRLVLYPYSKIIWAAIDFVTHEPEADDAEAGA